jgi:hypothetical protein
MSRHRSLRLLLLAAVLGLVPTGAGAAPEQLAVAGQTLTRAG